MIIILSVAPHHKIIVNLKNSPFSNLPGAYNDLMISNEIIRRVMIIDNVESNRILLFIA